MEKRHDKYRVEKTKHITSDQCACEMTGLIPRLPQSRDELEAYEDIMDTDAFLID